MTGGKSEGVPFTHFFDLNSLAKGGAEEQFDVPEKAREIIAEWYDVDGIDRIHADLKLERVASNEYLLEGRLDALVRQTCVVTLEPLENGIVREFTRRLRVIPASWSKRSENVIDVDVSDDEEVDLLESPAYDLAAPVLEELSLAIDPYPKAPGAALPEPSEEDRAAASPFAALQELKDRQSGGKKSQ